MNLFDWSITNKFSNFEYFPIRSIHSKCKESKKYKKYVVLKVEIIIENLKNLWFQIPTKL
jgi:hypothetical protein